MTKMLFLNADQTIEELRESRLRMLYGYEIEYIYNQKTKKEVEVIVDHHEPTIGRNEKRNLGKSDMVYHGGMFNRGEW